MSSHLRGAPTLLAPSSPGIWSDSDSSSDASIWDSDDSSADDWSVSNDSDDESLSSTEDNFILQQFNNCKRDNLLCDLQDMRVLSGVHGIRSSM